MADQSEDIEHEEQEEEQEEGQGFLSHIEELRKRIFIALAWLIAGCIIAAVFVTELMETTLLRPAKVANLDLQNLRPFGQVFLHFKVILVAGAIFSLPFMLHQLWLFIAPGLYDDERRWARQITFFTTVCFAIGISFAYFVMIPTMLSFASTFGTADIKNIIDITEYFGFVSTTLLAAGVIFELPMISFVLAKVGILTSTFMRTYRRHSFVIILIIAAVLTPTPDPINQLIFAIPLWLLYEISIFIVKVIEKKNSQPEQTST